MIWEVGDAGLFYALKKHALRLLASLPVLTRIPSSQLLFLQQLRKSNQKEAARHNALHPAITSIRQVAQSRSRRRSA